MSKWRASGSFQDAFTFQRFELSPDGRSHFYDSEVIDTESAYGERGDRVQEIVLWHTTVLNKVGEPRKKMISDHDIDPDFD